MAEAYPLQWPEGRPRTLDHKRVRSNFKSGFTNSRDWLFAELKRLGARLPVLSTNIELRLDGLPYASRRTPEDPGAAIYFEYKGKQMCFACDKYRNVGCNIHAIAKTIDALRGISRWGTGDMLARAFAGFEALPAPGEPDWRDVLQYYGHSLQDANNAYKKARVAAHPDKGGSSKQFYLLNRAWAQAEKELSL